MKVYHHISELGPIKNPVVTIGTFDGVHTGHLEILELLKKIASGIDGETVIITFHPHPRKVLYPDDDSLKLLTSIDEKLYILEQIGIDHVLILDFGPDISQQEPEDFTKDILVNGIGAKHLVIGHDHRFGKNRRGDFNTMMQLSKEYNFVVEEIPPYLIHGITVSSTQIRNSLLVEFDLDRANDLLGRYYSISGTVAHGNQNGRKLGFPTCNLHIEDSSKLIPIYGVYVAHAYINANKYNALVNIGNRPTFNLQETVVEAHLLNFSEEVYGAKIKLDLIKRLRGEQKFESLDALKMQIAQDIETAKNIFEKTI